MKAEFVLRVRATRFSISTASTPRCDRLMGDGAPGEREHAGHQEVTVDTV